MKGNQFLLLLSFIGVITISVIGGTGCANIVPPAGGPRDSVAPLLLKAEPGDSSRNFKSNHISFTFDEFVEVQNAYQEVLVSPLPKNNPTVDYRLNTVTVKLKDTLEPNTTYTIDFGQSIKDINESNILKNFTYTFSTGSYLDSLEFGGTVLLAETGKTDTTLIVMLHASTDDSAVVNEKPRYITKVNSKGQFLFKNLPPKTYKVYALQDEGSRRYLDDKQLFAFADVPVTISDSTTPVTLYAYKAKAEEERAAAPTTTPSGRNRGNAPAASERRLRFNVSTSNGTQDLLSSFIMGFEQPLKTFDSTKIGFFTDTTFTPVTNWRFERDSTNTKFKLLYTWKENTLYHFIFDKDFAEDSAGRKLLKTDTLDFKTKKLSDYGQIKIKFRNLDISKNPVLFFVLNNAVVQSFPLNGPDFSQTLFLPGDYELRILYDNNKNGKWDPGIFFDKHQQPELVHPIDRKVTVKPNWVNDFEIAL